MPLHAVAAAPSVVPAPFVVAAAFVVATAAFVAAATSVAPATAVAVVASAATSATTTTTTTPLLLLCSRCLFHRLCCRRCSRCLCPGSVCPFPPPQCQCHCWLRRCLCCSHHSYNATATAGATAAAASDATTTATMPLLLPGAAAASDTATTTTTPPLSLPPPDTALPLAYCWLLFVVCCYLHLPLQLSSPTHHTPALSPSMQPPLPVLPLLLWQPSLSGREAPAEDEGSGRHGQVLFGIEVKKVYFSPKITKQRAFLSCRSKPDSFWREQESRGIWRNQVQIQEFLCRRNSCKKIL